MTTPPLPALDEDALRRLHALNDALRLVTAKIKTLGLEKTHELMARLDANDKGLCDFHVSAWVVYQAETDPSEVTAGGCDDVSCTGIQLDFKIPGSEKRWEGDMEFFYDCPQALQSMNPVWLMHELYKTGENGKPEVPFHECLRINTIEVTVITHEAFVFDVPTQTWMHGLRDSTLFKWEE